MYCFQRTGTLALALSGVNQKSSPLLIKKSSPVANSGLTFSIRRERVGDSIHCCKCDRVSNRIMIVYVPVSPEIGRTMCQSRWPGEALQSGAISLNQFSYSACLHSRTLWVMTTVAPSRSLALSEAVSVT